MCHLRAGSRRTTPWSVHTTYCCLNGRCAVLGCIYLVRLHEVGRQKWWSGSYALLVVAVKISDEQMQRGLASSSWCMPGSSSQQLTNSCPGHQQGLTETYRGNSCAEARFSCHPSLRSPFSAGSSGFWDWQVGDSNSTVRPSFPSSSPMYEGNSRGSPCFHITQGTVLHFSDTVWYRRCSTSQSEDGSVSCVLLTMLGALVSKR